MSDDKTGGPAFPRAASELNYDSEGMTLRQYYAGQALIGSLAGRQGGLSHAIANSKSVAQDCLLLADALIAAERK